MKKHRANLLSIYHAALKAVHGRECVSGWLRQHPQAGSCHVIAIGKAAAAMAMGALDVLGNQLERMLVITRHGYGEPELSRDSRVRQMESGHPVPDQSSLDAGQAMLDFIAGTHTSTPLLFLISGGASALVEVLPEDLTLTDLRHVNHWLLGSGLPIESMNAVRIALSRIKGGRLSAYLQGRKALVLLVSDVPDDDPAIIGSGLLHPDVDSPLGAIDDFPDWLNDMIVRASSTVSVLDDACQPEEIIPHHVVASADHARWASLQQAQQLGYHTYEHQQRVTGDINVVAAQLSSALADNDPGLHIWTGETTVELPEKLGNGGRCQSLALTFALQQQCHDLREWLFLAAGSDGSDGASEAAGALVDGLSVSRIMAAGLDPRQCLIRADAGTCLNSAQDLIITGPTGTNVMDIMLGLRLV